MKRNQIRNLIGAAMFSSLVVAACTRDSAVVNENPSWHIAESEKLVIPAAVDLPANLPGGNTRIATHYAIGVQKYKAQAKAGTTPVVYEWVFVAPKANLYDASNNLVGTHSAGPTWQLFGASPGAQMDSIYAQQFVPAKNASSPLSETIDWLLLQPKTGKIPTGRFVNVSYIQRIATKGGKAPVTPPVSATDTVEVHYTAIYRFSQKN